MTTPPIAAYRLAQIATRNRAGSLTQLAARQVADAINAWIQTLTQRLALLDARTSAARRDAIIAMRNLAAQAERELRGAITAAVRNHRRVAFTDILAIWQRASVAALDAERAIDEAASAAALRVAPPNITLAGAYEALGGAASTWTDSLGIAARLATREVDGIVSRALAAGVGPQELARRLLPYMQGADTFAKMFPKADERFKALNGWRTLNPDLADAARQVRAKALRVAYSEVNNARAEAELTAFAIDPLVHGVRWELSPFRGSLVGPDICDALARNDFYGLGAGVYPLDRVPFPPHPRDRCERVPVTVPVSQAGKPKPKNLARVLQTDDAKVGATGGQSPITKAQGNRIRDQLDRQFHHVEDVVDPATMHRLIQIGEAAAAKLAA